MNLPLAHELENIIVNEAISPLFQPIFNILEHKIHGFEALSRGPEHSPLHSPVPLFQTAAQQGRLSELETLCRRISLEQFKLRHFQGRLF
ncbi:MAG: GGDEF domain-containing protein, partial [Shewanella sp.]